MKIKDIIPFSITRKIKDNFPYRNLNGDLGIDTVKCEISTLVDSDICGDLSSCALVKEDEREMAAAILSMVYNVPDYQPSPLARHVVKSINNKIASYEFWLSKE